MLPPCQHPGIFTGEFNSHSTEWGYNEEDQNGEKLVNWTNINHIIWFMMLNKAEPSTQADSVLLRPRTSTSLQKMN